MNINAAFRLFFASCGLVLTEIETDLDEKHKHIWPCVAAVLEYARSINHVQLSVSKCDEQALGHTLNWNT